MWSAIAGAATGALLNAGSSAANAGIQYGTSKALAKYNYELGQRSLRNSPKNYKQGLIDAGINPILASHSPVGATQGSSGVNPGMSLDEGAYKGASAVNEYKQAKSTIELQGKQGDAAERQADASWLNALTNAKKAGVEVKGIESNISLNEARKATEQALQRLHLSDAHKSEVQSLAIDVAQKMDKMQLEYWKDHQEQFNDFMKESLQSAGNINSARDFQKWTDLGKAVLQAADTIMSYSPFGKLKLGVPKKTDNPFKKYMDKGFYDDSKKNMSINDYELRDLK